MENGNSDETKANAEAEEAKPSKPSLIEKLKNKRWTFKIKNNFSKYVTVEPLICFYMIQIFVESSLIRPYMFHKACVEINEDTYFCDIMTSNWHIDDKLCATYELYGTLFCKRQDDLHFDDIDEPLECDVITRMYSESNTSAIQVTPEHYRFCRLGQKVLEKMYTSYSLIGISALTGGMSLFLFGCFSYMVHEAVRRKLLFRFGVISLILIVFRQIPHLTDAVHKFYHRSYQNSFILNLVFSIICLLYIKIILNESKRQVDVNALKNESASLKSEPQSTRDGRSSVNRRKSKIQHLVKVFSLDVIWDYILIVFKKRRHNGRAVILTFLIVAFLCRMSLFGLLNHIEMRKDFPFAFMDVDGAIFVIFSILLVTFNTSEAVISILVIVIPPLMRLILSHFVCLRSNIFDKKSKMRKVLCNLFVLSTVVILRADLFSKKYSPDDNRIIKRLHASTHAKLFLYGCVSEPYTQLNVSDETESDFFKLHKAGEYVFAIFTLDEVSIIISNKHPTSGESDEHENHVGDMEDSYKRNDFVQFNITLGLDKNKKALLEMYVNETMIRNMTEVLVPILPTIPYYINVSITGSDISVYEARTDAPEPFLHANFSINAPMDEHFVKFRHWSPILAHYDCCETCTEWLYIRVSGCSKYSARTASTESETTFSLTDIYPTNLNEHVLFSQNIVVNHDGNPIFSAKILFAENDVFHGNRYEIDLSDNPTILHYVNSSAQYTQSGQFLKKQYTTPFMVNITITKDGIVSLRQPYDDNPFLTYVARFQKSNLKPVDVKFMKMLKFHDDFIRYDFFFNCTEDVLVLSDRIEQLPEPMDYEESLGLQSTDDIDTDTHPFIWEYMSKRYKTLKYDVLHAFQDSYQIYEKSKHIAYKDNNDYEDEPQSANLSGQSSEKPKVESTKSKGYADMIKKAVVGVGSFLCVGILKFIFSLDCVKNLMKEVDMDDDRAKDLRQSASKVVKGTVATAYYGANSMLGISALILTFLVTMIVSIWSDKNSKRKMCLMLPIFGQLLISIMNLHGAYSNFLSFDFINTASTLIAALTGGMPLFGVISLILTLYRHIPYLYETLYQYYHDDDSYKHLIILTLVFNVLCLLYVKIILNESKREVTVNGSDCESRSQENERHGKGKIASKGTKRKQMAKAFSLDVIWDYILIVFKKRSQNARIIILVFMAVVFIDKLTVFNERMTTRRLDIVDFDGVIFVIISIIMSLFKISDVVIAILVIGIPAGARLMFVTLQFRAITVTRDFYGKDFYAPFKQIASCCLLLAYIDKNESRIFLIVQLIAYLPRVIFHLFLSIENDGIFAMMTIASALLVFGGLGLLYFCHKKYQRLKANHLPFEDITESPWKFIEPANFEHKSEDDKLQLETPSQLSKQSENSTDL
ncbi:hypothetical protein Bhyg_00961 [Pseudolycoriella hygida]|uniref:Uncharacterized protein n=1 Tax=Pseudolycoriella hygida TaxID=35572 RepID=A0A9Q0N8J1_9DIPT|nr:hypothetical protein Bhyg_00961 [Pseudolycoriella hygida]